jgi:DNA-binding NtrC family response regulator
MKRILLVDDDPGVRNALKIGLISYGFDVMSAENGLHAIRRIEKLLAEARPADLLVTDFRMQEMDGLRLIQKAKGLQPSLITILITGYGNETLREECERFGVNTYMEKPFTPDTLGRKIHELLETGCEERDGSSRPVPRQSGFMAGQK